MIVLCKYYRVIVDWLIEHDIDFCLAIDKYDKQAFYASDVAHVPAHVFEVSTFDSVESICWLANSLENKGIKITRIISAGELAQYGAGLLQTMTGAEGITLDLANNTRDKRRMKSLLASHDIRCARFADVTSVEEIESMPRRLNFPVVAKPVNGFGSMNTMRIDSPAELSDFYRDFRAQHPYINPFMMCEEFIDSDEYVVDAVWKDGRPIVFSISKYLIPQMRNNDPGRVYTGATHLNRLDHARFYERMLALHRRVNVALGIDNCATHTEFFVTNDGDPIISEVASRVGGCWFNELTRDVYGKSLQDIHLSTHVLDIDRDPYLECDSRSHTTISWTAQKPGRIKAFPTRAYWADIPHMEGIVPRKGIGDPVSVRQWSDYIFYAHFAGIPADVNRAIETFAARFERDIDQFIEPAS